MQVNNKSLLFILGITVILFFIFGCTSAPNPSISGKTLIGNDGGLIINSKTVPAISIKQFLADKKEVTPEPEFVPDEIIVKYQPGAGPSMVTKSISGSGFTAARSLRSTGNGDVTLLKLDKSEKGIFLTDHVKDRTLREIDRLNSLPSVKYAEPNYIYRGLYVPSDPGYPSQWHYPLIKLGKLWDDISLNDFDDMSSVTVAVLDTGIGKTSGGNYHEDLDGIFRDQYDFVNYLNISLDLDGHDPDATDSAGSTTGYHGTHVAGTIGAITNNSIGVAGVGGGKGLGVRIMPLRVLGKGGVGYAIDIAQAILYAAGLNNSYGVTPPSQKADVINMSFGSPGNSSFIMDAVNDAYNAGVTLIAAAGNETTSSPVYPAAYSNVISVSAVSIGAERAYYSNYGDTIDIAAPGGDIRFDLDFDGQLDGINSTIIESGSDGYAYLQGTSMAAPHAAGAAAIIIKGLQTIFTPVTPENVKNIMQDTAINIGIPEFFGAGLLNVYAAAYESLGLAQGPELTPFPKTIRLEAADSISSFILRNTGQSGSFTIDSIVEINDSVDLILPAGIFPTSGTVDTNNSLQVQVSLDLNGKKDGATYFASIEITYDGLYTEHLNVIYKYIGDVYVVVLDSDSLDIVAMAITNYEEGYEYIIEDLNAGSYIVGASTDRDEDGWIFESNEAYGFYPGPGYEDILNLSYGQKVSGIDFILVDELL